MLFLISHLVTNSQKQVSRGFSPLANSAFQVPSVLRRRATTILGAFLSGMESRPVAYRVDNARKLDLLDCDRSLPGCSVKQSGDGGAYALPEFVRRKCIEFDTVGTILAYETGSAGIGVFHQQRWKVELLNILLMNCETSQLYVTGLGVTKAFPVVRQNAGKSFLLRVTPTRIVVTRYRIIFGFFILANTAAISRARVVLLNPRPTRTVTPSSSVTPAIR